MEVFRVLVKDEAAKFLHRELNARPDLGDVEGVKSEFLWGGFLGLHDLHHGSPLRLLTRFDGFPKVALRVIGIFSRNANCFRFGKLLRTMFGNEMVLDVSKFAFFVYPEKTVAIRL